MSSIGWSGRNAAIIAATRWGLVSSFHFAMLVFRYGCRICHIFVCCRCPPCMSRFRFDPACLAVTPELCAMAVYFERKSTIVVVVWKPACASSPNARRATVWYSSNSPGRMAAC